MKSPQTPLPAGATAPLPTAITSLCSGSPKLFDKWKWYEVTQSLGTPAVGHRQHYSPSNSVHSGYILRLFTTSTKRLQY